MRPSTSSTNGYFSSSPRYHLAHPSRVNWNLCENSESLPAKSQAHKLIRTAASISFGSTSSGSWRPPYYSRRHMRTCTLGGSSVEFHRHTCLAASVQVPGWLFHFELASRGHWDLRMGTKRFQNSFDELAGLTDRVFPFSLLILLNRTLIVCKQGFHIPPCEGLLEQLHKFPAGVSFARVLRLPSSQAAGRKRPSSESQPTLCPLLELHTLPGTARPGRH